MLDGKPGADNFLGPNLINRLYQLEGPWGFTAGIAEMLLQSHEQDSGFGGQGSVQSPDAAATSARTLNPEPYLLNLLPALPKAWAKGKVTGLRARGNFTVDIEWRDGKVTQYRIASPEPREVKVRVNGETKTIQSEKAKEIRQ